MHTGLRVDGLVSQSVDGQGMAERESLNGLMYELEVDRTQFNDRRVQWKATAHL